MTNSHSALEHYSSVCERVVVCALTYRASFAKPIEIKESYSAGGGEWHGYLTGFPDRGKVTSTGRTTNRYWSP